MIREILAIGMSTIRSEQCNVCSFSVIPLRQLCIGLGKADNTKHHK